MQLRRNRDRAPWVRAFNDCIRWGYELFGDIIAVSSALFAVFIADSKPAYITYLATGVLGVGIVAWRIAYAKAKLEDEIAVHWSGNCGDATIGANNRNQARTVVINDGRPETYPVDFLGVVIRNEGFEIAESCQVLLVGLKKDGSALKVVERNLQFEPKTFAERNKENESPIIFSDMLGGEARSLALCTIIGRGYVLHGSLGMTWQNECDFNAFFDAPGTYDFVLEVRARNKRPTRMSFLLDWKNDRTMADFSKPTNASY